MNGQEIVTIDNGTPLADSRPMASACHVGHRSLYRLIQEHQTDIEENFGIMRFQIAEIKGRGQPEKFALLTEPQATLVMTFLKNTKPVVAFKVALVKAFEKAKELLKGNIPDLSAVVSEIKELNAEVRKLAEQPKVELRPATRFTMLAILRRYGKLDQYELSEEFMRQTGCDLATASRTRFDCICRHGEIKRTGQDGRYLVAA